MFDFQSGNMFLEKLFFQSFVLALMVLIFEQII